MRWRSQRDGLLTMAMMLFAAGLVALAVTFGLFATGQRRLPMWLSLSSLLLPLGLVLGVFRTRRLSARQPQRSERHRQHADPQPSDPPDH